MAGEETEETPAPSSDIGPSSLQTGSDGCFRGEGGGSRGASTALLKDLTTPRENSMLALKALTPLVAMPPPSTAAVYNRLEKQNYSRLGRNLLFEARPAVSTS